jgi:HK97 gp10 family phage protein
MKLTDFESKMKAAAGSVSNLQSMLQMVAFKVEENTKPHVPVLTGNLRRSIHTRVAPPNAYIGTNVSYALFVHEGTKHMPARPFFDMGMHDSMAAIDSIMTNWGTAIWQKVK